MLLSDDVVEMEGQFCEIFREVTILTAMLRPEADSSVNSLVHL